MDFDRPTHDRVGQMTIEDFDNFCSSYHWDVKADRADRLARVCEPEDRQAMRNYAQTARRLSDCYLAMVDDGSINHCKVAWTWLLHTAPFFRA